MTFLKPFTILFFMITFLWCMLFGFTFVPWLAGISFPTKEYFDITFITLPFFGFTFVSLSLWLILYVLFPFVRKKGIDHQKTLITNSRFNKPTYQPLVSVIIPGRNEQQVIRKTVLNILDQTYQNIEIIVVCHNCTDRTYEEAQVPDKRVRVLDFQTTLQGKGVALNYGIDHASGEYVCVVDSDGKLSGNFLKDLLPLFDEGIAAVQGLITSSNQNYNMITRLLTVEGDLYSEVFWSVKNYFDKRVPLGGTGLVINKNILIKVGRFGNSLIDDFDLSFRLFRNKYRIAFAPMSIDWDEKPPMLRMIFNQRARWMKGHLDHLRRPVAEPRDIVGHIYWLSPVICISSLIAFSIASFNNLYFIFFGQFAYHFSAIPVVAWFIMICVSYCFQISFLILSRKYSLTQCFLYPLLLSPFSTYWYVCMVKAFFVKGWGTTKTTHGYQVSSSTQKSKG